MRLGQRGFTLAEVLAVLLVIGILVNIALPASRHWVRRTKAVKVITDFEVVRDAVYMAYGENESYPASSPWGATPPDLAAYLPRDFEFRYDEVTYRWKRWSLPDGTPGNRKQQVLMGMQIRSNDRALIQSIQSQWYGRSANAGNTKLTFVVL